MYERWTTLHIPPKQRARFWQDATAQAFVSLTPEISRPEDFQAEMIHRSLGSLALNSVIAPPHGVARTRSDLRRDDARLVFFNLYLAGGARLRSADTDLQAMPGELLAFDSSVEFDLSHPADTRLLSLAVPASELPAQLKIEGNPRVLQARTTIALLKCQLHELANWQGELAAQESQAIADALIGSIVAAFIVDQPSTDMPTPNSVRQVRRIIERRYHEAGFSASDAAYDMGISLRTLHARCAQAGVTFAALLMAYRLMMARDQLLKTSTDTDIAAIANRCGFVSAAHFSRRFRQRFGHPPSALRAS